MLFAHGIYVKPTCLWKLENPTRDAVLHPPTMYMHAWDFTIPMLDLYFFSAIFTFMKFHALSLSFITYILEKHVVFLA